jgi:hypothetical protein
MSSCKGKISFQVRLSLWKNQKSLIIIINTFFVATAVSNVLCDCEAFLQKKFQLKQN